MEKIKNTELLLCDGGCFSGIGLFISFINILKFKKLFGGFIK